MRDMFDLMKILPVGAEAPKFNLKDVDGNTVSLDDFLGKQLIVLEFGSFT